MATNRAILVLRALLTPGLDGATPQMERLRSDAEWKSAAGLEREAYENLETRVRDFYDLIGFDSPDGGRCFERLGRSEPGGYGKEDEGMKTCPSAGVPVKGEVVPLVVEQIGLPLLARRLFH